MDPEEQARFLAPTREQLASVTVFPLIAYLKEDATTTIDSPLTWDQLTASNVNFAIVRPLVFKYARLDNMAVIYACMVVRSHFLVEAASHLEYSGVNFSRATLCELLAMKLVGNFASNPIQLVAVLTTGWNPLAGAPPDIVEEVKQTMGPEHDAHNPQSALELAVTTKSKAFLSSPVVQSVVNDIYSGRVVFSTAGNRSMLSDNYKPRAIEIYDCTTAPFVNHYRLRVPKYGKILEFWNITVLLMIFILCLTYRDLRKINTCEAFFILFAAAFTLGEYTAANEHGWHLYIANIWNVVDATFIVICLTYIVFRIKGLVQSDSGASKLSFDLLACGACILFPRLAFFAVSNNMVVLALRAMISEFIFFMSIAAICFSGLLFTLWTLASDRWTISAIAWLMVQIWFGNTYLSFGQASSFHPFFGPILMTLFACLANTLLLTILISILSNTVARIDANANQEYLFQYAITTIQGVNSDALFSYQPPFNLLAFIILKPASWFLSPRALHSANVFLIKLTSFPVLIIIGIYERHFAAGQRLRQSSKNAAHSLYNSLPRRIRHIPFLEAMVGSHSSDLYEAIFEVEISHQLELFDGLNDELPAMHSPGASRANAWPGESQPGSPTRNRARSPRSDRDPPSPQESPRPRKTSNFSPLVETFSSTEVPSLVTKSPLSKLFGVRSRISTSTAAPDDHPLVDTDTVAVVKKMEGLLGEMRELPIQGLKDQMKELQDRQTRIENLLLMLTRSMRDDTGTSSGTSSGQRTMP